MLVAPAHPVVAAAVVPPAAATVVRGGHVPAGPGVNREFMSAVYPRQQVAWEHSPLVSSHITSHMTGSCHSQCGGVPVPAQGHVFAFVTPITFAGPARLGTQVVCTERPSN